jgi:myosin-1
VCVFESMQIFKKRPETLVFHLHVLMSLSCSGHAHFGKTTTDFFIKHYAGEVKYKLGKLGESNKDALGSDLLLLLASSQDKLMQHLFPAEEAQEMASEKKNSTPSAGNRIRVQCQALVTSLMQCTPHYVRCIKSNDQKAPLTIEQARVVHQIKYLGLSENIKVRRAGFAYRAEYHRFLDRFGILSKATYPEWRGTEANGCKEILKEIAKSMPQIKEQSQMGRTKLFVRKPETYFAVCVFLKNN